jgi:hypothetical protein
LCPAAPYEPGRTPPRRTLSHAAPYEHAAKKERTVRDYRGVDRCGRGWRDRKRNSKILEWNGAGWAGKAGKVSMLEWEKLDYHRVERRVRGKGGGYQGWEG